MTNITTKTTGLPKPDLSASLVTEQDGEKIWTPYFAVYLVKDGYFKGTDKDGDTIIVQTLAAKDSQLEQQENQPTGKRRPDLFIYREDDEEGGIVWTELFAAWQGKKDGVFTAKHEDDNDIVLQTQAAREANFKHRQNKRVAPVDLSTAFETEPDTES